MWRELGLWKDHSDCVPWGQKAANSPTLMSRWAPGSLLIHKMLTLSGFLSFYFLVCLIPISVSIHSLGMFL